MTDFLNVPYSTYAEAAAAKAEKKAANAWKRTMKEAKVYVDPSTLLPRQTAEVLGNQLLTKLQAKLVEMTDSGKTTLARFTAGLVERGAANAFEWSQDAFAAAATVKVAQEVADFMLNANQERDSYTQRSKGQIFELILQQLTQDVLRGARFPVRSTSVQSNLIEQETLAARAKLVEDMTRWQEFAR